MVYVPFTAAASCGVTLHVLRKAPIKLPSEMPYILPGKENDNDACRVLGIAFA
jgi:hypothetical protein